MRLILHFSLTLALMGMMTSPAMAWDIVTHADADNGAQMQIARTENNEGYSLEIYQDANGAIRLRFSIHHALLRLADRHCPSFQVDKRELTNRSVNDARCIASQQWVEFILGYVVNDEIRSNQLHNMMNGNKITYRFLLENEGYGETDFSLSGSKRVLSSIIGNNVTVRTDDGFSVDE